MKRHVIYLLAALGTSACSANAASDRDIVDVLKANMRLPVTSAKDAVRPAPNPTWRIRTGSTLRLTLTEWANTARYKVVWEARHGFDIEADATIPGDFVAAVTALFDAYRSAAPALYVDIYPDQRIIVVTSDTAETST
ncbi:toxin co-regulated pilus biosynthesis Q family protein [Pinirhizobacter soli]|uniref:toxin co-regulated pilus biosynthesis Q family protein n=1 Tax=Pinirhizobacter soli TaxID=2786953 RepID=UPI00202AC15A|nr:toxin co-regulated pilus biosynthesis Q family protein [Pinirhizobacter soli]